MSSQKKEELKPPENDSNDQKKPKKKTASKKVPAKPKGTTKKKASKKTDKTREAFELKGSQHGFNFGWYRNLSDNESRKIGSFDIIIHSKIIRYNNESLKWDEFLYECQVAWMDRSGKNIRHGESFMLEPKDLLSKKTFQMHVFKHSGQAARFKDDDEILFFMSFLCDMHQPQIVYEYDKYGFIRHGRHHFYLSRNAMITIPDNYKTEPSYVAAPNEDGIFPVKDFGQIEPAFYVRPARMEPTPEFIVPSPENGVYPLDNMYYDTYEVAEYAKEIRVAFGNLVSGQQPETKPEGWLMCAYMFSYLFMDDIKEEFGHVMFLYIWGAPSVGKGKVGEVMLNFFGQSTGDIDSSPTLKSVENKLSNHSRIPVIMDEFKPGESKIPPQTFNAWYHLQQRGVSAAHDRTKNAWTPVISQLVFFSNYDTIEAHFKTRCVIIEYSKQKRGHQETVWWFDKRKKQIQRLFISLCHMYNEYDREYFRDELQRIKQLLSDAVDIELQKRKAREGVSYSATDRQIDNMAGLLTVDYFICHPQQTDFAQRLLYREEDEYVDQQFLDMTETFITSSEIFKFGVQFLAGTAESDVEQTPFQKFLASLDVMQQMDAMPKRFHGWTGKPELGDECIVFYWNGVWDRYLEFNKGKGLSDLVEKETIRKEFMALAKDKIITTHRYSYEDLTTPGGIGQTSKHGFKIPKYNCTPAIFRAFGRNKDANNLVKIDGGKIEDEPDVTVVSENGQQSSSDESSVQQSVDFDENPGF